MNPGIILVLVILGVIVLMMVLDVVRIDIIAIGCMLALGWTGILDSQEMFSGFSSNAVIAILSVMILGQGIARTGNMLPRRLHPVCSGPNHRPIFYDRRFLWIHLETPQHRSPLPVDFHTILLQ